MKENWSEYALLIYDLNKIAEAGGDKDTLRRVREAIDAMAGNRIYVPRVLTKRKTLVDRAIAWMSAGKSRLDVIRDLQRISGHSRSTAARNLSIALSVKDHRARGIVHDQLDLWL